MKTKCYLPIFLMAGWFLVACGASSPQKDDDDTDSDTTTSIETCEVNNPCGEHGTCDDGSGVSLCICDRGWSGYTCEDCAAGFHMEGEACLLDQQCLPNSCGGQGECIVAEGVVVCDCNPGYTGEYCDSCAAGYHFEGGLCVSDSSCVDNNPCGDHGTCDDTEGIVVCTCDAGWQGSTCNQCAVGYHLENELCVLDQQCMPNSCSGHGECDDTGGQIVCTCDAGYMGSYCEDCSPNFHHEGTSCVANEDCEDSDPCGNNGICDDNGGIITCDCNDGWQGDICDGCAAGFHEVEQIVDGGDNMVTCELDTECLTTSCFGHGTCSIVNNIVTCACDDGYDGAFCSSCDSGYHKEGGLCIADASCGPDDAPCVNGSCSEVGGIVSCGCDTGWGGTFCDTCAGGYHHPIGDTTICVLDQECLPTSCSGHGTGGADGSGCTIVNSVVTCTCETGYTQASYCADCDATHHKENGICVPNMDCEELDPCGDNGTCVSDQGAVFCSCDNGWTGDFCDSCAAGFNEHGDACDMSCDLWGVNCGPHGTCVDDSAPAVCSCDSGFFGTVCHNCSDDSNEQNDSDVHAYWLQSENYNATGQVVCGNDEDWYTMQLNEGDIIEITILFSHAAGDLDLYLWKEYETGSPFSTRIDRSISTDDNENIVYEIPTGESALYLFQIVGSGVDRTTYTLDIAYTEAPGCKTCEDLGKECGTWDDNCGSTVTCGPCGGSEVCQEYTGVCAANNCELQTGCCNGTTLTVCDSQGVETDLPCGDFGFNCEWTDDPDQTPGLPGHFSCVPPGTGDPLPVGFIEVCPF